jgi:cell division septal protein FtsQ
MSPSSITERTKRKLAADARKASTKTLIWRWLITAGVVALAVYGLWIWAWLLLALATFHLLGDYGMAVVINQITGNMQRADTDTK